MNNKKIETCISTNLPNWVSDVVGAWSGNLGTDSDELMGYALQLLERQIKEKTGGPFASIIVGADGSLISVGVNLVVRDSDCTAHGETVALRLAGAKSGSFKLPTGATLVTTAQMCGMCLTALIWGGVARVIIGARAEDTIEHTGFDEGAIPYDWRDQLEKRGIEVLTDVRREECVYMLKKYVEEGGIIYNGGSAAGDQA